MSNDKLIKLAVVGSRQYPGLSIVEECVKGTSTFWDLLVSGGAIGVDFTAEQVAIEIEKPRLIMKPKGAFKHKGHFRQVAMDRNRIMAEYADIALVFWDGVSTGTKAFIDFCMHYNQSTDQSLYVVGPTHKPLMTKNVHVHVDFEEALWECFDRIKKNYE